MKFECIDAKQEFEDILKPFEATEIKSIDEFIDEDGIYYSANIIMSNDATSKIDKLIKDNGAQFIDNGEYMFDTKYGYCDISDDGDQFTIECFVPIEYCEQIDECINSENENYIPITEGDNTDVSIVYDNIISIGTTNSGIDEYHINITKNDDFYDVNINDSLYLQEPIANHDDWDKNDIELFALDSFVDFYKNQLKPKNDD